MIISPKQIYYLLYRRLNDDDLLLGEKHKIIKWMLHVFGHRCAVCLTPFPRISGEHICCGMVYKLSYYYQYTKKDFTDSRSIYTGSSTYEFTGVPSTSTGSFL